MCVNNLPKVVTRQCTSAKSNLHPWVTSGFQTLYAITSDAFVRLGSGTLQIVCLTLPAISILTRPLNHSQILISTEKLPSLLYSSYHYYNYSLTYQQPWHSLRHIKHPKHKTISIWCCCHCWQDTLCQWNAARLVNRDDKSALDWVWMAVTVGWVSSFVDKSRADWRNGSCTKHSCNYAQSQNIIAVQKLQQFILSTSTALYRQLIPDKKTLKVKKTLLKIWTVDEATGNSFLLIT